MMDGIGIAELDRHKWSNFIEMANLEPDETGLPTMVHLYQGQLRHAPRIKIQITLGTRIDRRNTVSVAIHDPAIVKGRQDLVSKFAGSAHHAIVKIFIEQNRAALLAHSRNELTDAGLRRRLKVRQRRIAC